MQGNAAASQQPGQGVNLPSGQTGVPADLVPPQQVVLLLLWRCVSTNQLFVRMHVGSVTAWDTTPT